MNGRLSRRELGPLLAGGLLCAPRAGSAAGAQERRVMLGVTSASFRDRGLDAAGAAMARLGVATCELWSGHVARGAAERVRVQVHGAGIGICAHDVTLPPGCSDGQLEEACAVTRALQAPWLDVACDDQTARRLIPFARRLGIEVALSRQALNRTAPLPWLAPPLGFTLDVGAFATTHRDPAAFLQKLHDRIHLVRFADAAASQAVLALLRDRAWPMPALAQCPPGVPDPEAAVRTALTSARQRLGQSV